MISRRLFVEVSQPPKYITQLRKIRSAKPMENALLITWLSSKYSRGRFLWTRKGPAKKFIKSEVHKIRSSVFMNFLTENVGFYELFFCSEVWLFTRLLVTPRKHIYAIIRFRIVNLKFRNKLNWYKQNE